MNRTTTNVKPRVVVIDDDETFLVLIKSIFYTKNIVCDSFTDPSIALKHLQKLVSLKTPCCLFTDLNLPTDNGLDIAKRVIKAYNVPVGLVTSDDDIMNALAAFDIGIYDMLMKPLKIERLLRKTEEMLDLAVERVNKAVLLASIDPNLYLTAKETEVVLLLLKGMSQSDVASALKVSENAVKFHKKNIYSKFYIKNHAELISKSEEIHAVIARSKQRPPKTD